MASLKILALALACSGFASAASAQSLTPVEENLAARIADPAGAIEFGRNAASGGGQRAQLAIGLRPIAWSSRASRRFEPTPVDVSRS